MRDLYIIGAGGFGREVAWLAERINHRKDVWNLRGFLDDDTAVLQYSVNVKKHGGMA